MEDQKSEKKDKDDNLIAAICHFSILLTMAMGPLAILVPLVIWLTQKDTSKHITFHAKQCFFYQLSVLVILAAMGIMAVSLMFILIGFFFIPIILFTGVAALVYGVVGGVTVLQGKKFKYYYIGDHLPKG